jgi:GAF domain-containing protein
MVKSKVYDLILSELPHFMTESWLTNFSNAAALLYQHLPDINWVGFYLKSGDSLILGPFCGKPACMEIKLGKGVCGKSALQRQTIIVKDVHLFDGHIACDSASQSEIVIPIIQNGKLIGVLDVDSPSLSRFDYKDAQELEKLVQVIVTKTNFSNLTL